LIPDEFTRWSSTAVRLSVSAGLVVAAWLLATCGAPATSSSGQSAAGDVLIQYRRTGGIAGLDDRLTIQADGQAILTRKGGERQTITLDKTTLSSLQATLGEADFLELESQYQPARDIPDAFHYEVSYQVDNGRHTVAATDSSVPEQLAPVLDKLNRIIARQQ